MSVSFVMKNEGLEYPEAVKKLADDNGIAIPQVTKFNTQKEEKIDRNYLLLEKICEFFDGRVTDITGRKTQQHH